MMIADDNDIDDGARHILASRCTFAVTAAAVTSTAAQYSILKCASIFWPNNAQRMWKCNRGKLRE